MTLTFKPPFIILICCIIRKADNQPFICCLGRIRTLTGGTRIRRATITPQGSLLFIRYKVRKNNLILKIWQCHFMILILQ